MPRFDLVESYVSESSAMICLRVDTEGIIMDANKSATALIPIETGTTSFDSLPVAFTAFKPLNKVIKDGTERYLYSFSTAFMPITLWCRFYEKDGSITVFGELDYDEIQAMGRVLVDTNRELSNLARELEKKRIKLDQAVKERNKVIGMVAHDLRNPIGNVESLATLIREDLAGHINDDNLQLLDLIISQSAYTHNMLTEMLDLSAIESGELRLNTEFLEVSELLDYACVLHKRQSENKNISLTQNIPNTIPTLYGDRVKLIQVFSNLISNALKFSKAGTSITLLADNTDSKIHIAISDQGPGIPADEISKLFNPFSRLSPQPTAGESSTGLGLAIVRKIIEAHRGIIEAESTLREGTTMHIYLPIQIKK